RAVAARDRAERRLLLAQPRLQAPVHAFAIRSLGVLKDEASANVGDVGIGEGADELPQRVGSPGRVGVGEGEDLAARLAHGAVLGRDLAAARAAEEANARLAGRD